MASAPPPIPGTPASPAPAPAQGVTVTMPANPAGNVQGTADLGTPANNAGQSLDPAAFWNAKPEGTAPPADPTADNKGFAEQFAAQLNGFKPPAIFTPEVLTEMGEGKTDLFNQNMQTAIQASLQHSVRLSMQLMGRVIQEQTARMEQMLTERLSGRDNTSLLAKEVPAYQNPALTPVVQRVFDQALLTTKGDAQKAVAMTKDMIQVILRETAGSMNMAVAPVNPGDSPSAPKDWVAELLAR